MFSPVYNLLQNHKALSRVGLLVCLLSATMLIVLWQKDEDASKREQKLQIDVAFIIHGSKNITSPKRKKNYKDALDWAKKIVKAFGEVGINKTRVGLIVYAEKPKLMFNFTDKLEKSEVMEGIDEAAAPPAIGNKTLTGKALWLALKALVNGTREEALKKFFVFSDRPPEDNAMSPALAIKKKNVDVYGLGKTTALYNDWYISDYSLDTMYTVLAAGPFKGRKNGEKDSSSQDQLSETTAASYRAASSSTTKANQVVSTITPIQYKDGENPPSSQVPEHTYNPVSKISEEKPSTLHTSGDSQSSGNLIASVISTAAEQPKEDLPKNNYGNDASVVVTVNSENSGKSVGHYSTGTDTPYKSTDFGTVIGGKQSTEGETQFSVVKPAQENAGENSNIRSHVRSGRRGVHKYLKRLLKYTKSQTLKTS